MIDNIEKVLPENGILIGRGTYSNVFLLKDSNPPMIIKYFDTRWKNNEAESTHFTKENKILEKLCHPNIVQSFGLVLPKVGTLFGIKMEYCERGNLRMVQKDPRVIYTMKTVLNWATQLFNALTYIDSFRIVHRDVKPENIFVTNDFCMKLGDFGCSRSVERTDYGTLTGTYRYMSPPELSELDERMDPETLISHRNDVYSMGLVLWELIERRLVFPQYEHFDHVEFIVDILAHRLTGLSLPTCQRSFQDLISRCANFQRKLRPRAAEVLAELQEIEKTDLFIGTLETEPLLGPKNQTVLLRPIGFDGSVNRVEIETQKNWEERFIPSSRSFNSSGASIGDLSNPRIKPAVESMKDSTRESLRKVEQDQEELLQKKKKMIDVPYRIECFQKAAQCFEFEIQEKANDENGLEDVQKIITEESKQQFFYNEDFLKNDRVPDKQTIRATFRYLIECNNDAQMSLYLKAFTILKQLRTLALEHWTVYEDLCTVMKELEEIKVLPYTRPLYFWSYFAISTKDEWILLNSIKIRQKYLNKFIKNDMSEIRYFFGEWQEGDFKVTKKKVQIRTRFLVHVLSDDQMFKLIKIVEDNPLTDRIKKEFAEGHNEVFSVEFRKTDVLNYKSLKSIPIARLSKTLAKAKVQLKRVFEVLTPRKTQESHKLNLIFQLRSPPTHFCKHNPRCAEGGGYPESELLPSVTKVRYDACANGEEIRRIELFVQFCRGLNQLQAESYRNIKENCVKWYLEFSDPVKANDPSRTFHFLYCSGVKVQGLEKKLILLDLPKNYAPNEGIPCFDERLNFYMVNARECIKSLENAKDRRPTFVTLDQDMNASLLDEKSSIFTIDDLI